MYREVYIIHVGGSERSFRIGLFFKMSTLKSESQEYLLFHGWFSSHFAQGPFLKKFYTRAACLHPTLLIYCRNKYPSRKHVYMHKYGLGFGSNQMLFRVLDPTAAIEFATPDKGMKFIFSSLGFMAPYFMVYILYIPCNYH